MKKACLVVAPPYLKSEIFNRQNLILNRDNCLAFFHFLQEKMRLSGYDLQTQDIHSIQNSELVLYNDMPRSLPAKDILKKSAVFLFESELIKPENWSQQSQQHFWKVFTWNDELVDKKKYFKLSFTHSESIKYKNFNQRKKLATLIAGNKSVRHPLELYSKRVEAIRWFEKYHPEDFEFYGMGWDQYTFRGLWRPLNRLRFFRKIFAATWPSYKGPVNDKLQTLSNYKFSICYENAKEIPGYITEKIFDSMAAGCIPVYWGAPNILDFVPSDCFINRKLFQDMEELYRFLIGMSEKEYNRRLQAIELYLQSEQHRIFEPEWLAKKVVSDLLSHN